MHETMQTGNLQTERATRSVNTRIEMSQDRVLCAIAAIKTIQPEGPKISTPPMDDTAISKLMTVIERCHDGIHSQYIVIDELVAGQLSGVA